MPPVADHADLAAVFGSGHLAITLDPTDAAERYQGIVALEGASLTAVVEAYFRDSEQLPTLVATAVSHSPATGWIAGGLLLQYLPRGEEGRARLFAQDDGAPEPADWQHMRILAATITPGELTDPALSAEALLWRLFHEEGGACRRRPDPDPRLPLLGRPYQGRARPVPRSRTRNHARRRRADRSRLPVLQPRLHGRAVIRRAALAVLMPGGARNGVAAIR